MNARALTEKLATLLRNEHHALAEFLVQARTWVTFFDQSRAWVEMGYASLFYYLHRELRLSKGAAQYRKVAAELIQRVPSIVEPLRRGDLCLSSVIEAAKVVTAENWETVLPRFYGLSRREAMEVVAELQPHPAPPERTVITPVRPVRCSSEAQAAQRIPPAPAAPPLLLDHEGASPETSGVPARSATPPPLLDTREGASPETWCVPVTVCPDQVEPATGWPVNQPPPTCEAVLEPRSFDVQPLTADRSRMHLTVSREFLHKLEAAQDALSNAMPDATPAEILEAGLDLLLAQAAKRRGVVEKPQKKVRPAKDDHIPAHVRREVWIRDGGRCQYPLASGGICGATRHLELDHIKPRALGGTSTADNLRVACKPHNDLAARLTLGDELMDRYGSGLRGARRPRSRGAGVGVPASSPRDADLRSPGSSDGCAFIP